MIEHYWQWRRRMKREGYTHFAPLMGGPDGVLIQVGEVALCGDREGCKEQTFMFEEQGELPELPE